MKKLIGLIILAIFTIPDLSAQWTTSGSNIYNSNAGNIGIGTTNPLEKLQISNGNLLISGNNEFNTLTGTVKFSTTSFPASWAGIGATTNASGMDQVDLLFYTAYGGASEKMRIMSNTGNVGIGTSSPLAKLDVRGGAILGSTKKITISPDYTGWGELPSGSYVGTNGANSLTLAPSTDVASAGAKVVLGYASTNWWSALEVANVASGFSNLLLMKSGGNVGIGITNPTAKLDINGGVFSSGAIAIGTKDITKIGSNMLAVNGSAIFTKAKVALYGSTWPDYVFTPDYKLPILDSLEQFIKSNGHLPEVPKSEEVEKNGIDLGNNQILLLKKIEELTLIAIEQNKKIEEQSKRISELEKKSD